MPNKMDYGLHFYKYPKDKAFLFQMKFSINRIMKQRKTNNFVQSLQKLLER